MRVFVLLVCVFQLRTVYYTNALPEPELFRGYDPNKKVFNQEVELIHDLEPIEVSDSEAQKFKLQHGRQV